MDQADNLGPATLGTLNGTGFLNQKKDDSNGSVQGQGTLIVDGVTREEVEALMGETLTYFGPTEAGDTNVSGCRIESVEDFPTITFSTGGS